MSNANRVTLLLLLCLLCSALRGLCAVEVREAWRQTRIPAEELTAMSGDSRLLAIRSSFGVISLYLVSDFYLLRRIDPQCGVQAMSLTQDGRVLATCGTDFAPAQDAWQRVVKLWNTADGTLVGTFPLQGERYAVSDDGRKLAVGRLHTIDMIDITTGKLEHRFPYREYVSGLSFSHNGKLLAVARMKEVDLLDTTTYARVRTLSTRADRIRHIVFSPNDRLIAAGSQDGTGCIWHVDSAESFIIRLRGFSPLSMTFSPDGTQLAFCGGGYLIYTLGSDLPPQKMVLRGILIKQVAISRTGNSIYLVMNGRVEVRKIETGEITRTLQETSAMPPIRGVWFTPDANAFATATGAMTYGLCRLRDCGLLQEWQALANPTLAKHGYVNQGVGEVAFSPDGKRMAALYYRNINIREVDDTDDHSLVVCGPDTQYPDETIHQILFTPDGKEVAVCGVSMTSPTKGEGFVKFRRISDGKVVKALKLAPKYIQSARFSRDGRWMAAGSCEPSNLWLVRRGDHTVVRVFERHIGLRHGYDFTPDSSDLFTCSIRYDVVRHHLKDGTSQVLPGMKATALLVSPDGRWLLTGYSVATLWRLPSLEKAATFAIPPHGGYGLENMTFSPDGNRLIVACDDGIMAWDIIDTP